MLEQLRRSTKSGFSYILVVMLIVVFAVFFGAPPEGCRPAEGRALMANVSGQDIHTEDVNMVFNRVFGGQQQRNTNDAQFISQQAMSLRMVLLTHLLANRAEQAGLRVDDAEFRDYLLDGNRNMEFRWVYGRDGQFDGQFYKNYIQSNLRVTTVKYENFKRRELLARKYLAMVDMQVNVTPQEIEEFHKLRNTQVNLEFVQFAPQVLKDFVEVTDEEVATFVSGNADAIQKDYEANRSKYEEAEQVLIRRIFIVKPEGAEARAEASARFENAKRRVMEENESFAAVAAELTEDYAREREGLMDWSTLDNLDQNIANALEGTEVGAVKEVDTDFAYMLIKLEDRKEATSTPLSEVQDEIARNLLQERKVDGLAAELAQTLQAQAKEAGSLEAALAALQPEGEEPSPWTALEVKETGLFSLEGQDMSAMFGNQFPGLQLGRTPWDRVPEIGKSPELAADAFKLTAEAPAGQKVYNVAGSKVVVRLKERQEPEGELSDKERMELSAEARSARASELLGPSATVLVVPSDDYGPWLENMFREALEKGEIRLYDSNSPAAAQARLMAEPTASDLELSLGGS